MALSNAAKVATCSSCCCLLYRSVSNLETEVKGLGVDRTFFRVSDPFCLRRTRVFTARCRLNAIDTRIVENARTTTSSTVEIPVSCYQIIGVPNQAEKDEIVKSVMDLKRAEIEEGYTMDVVMLRQDLLMDIRDKLLFEPEYAGNIREKIPPKSCLKIPLAWSPGALCLLQERMDMMVCRFLDPGWRREPCAGYWPSSSSASKC